MGIGRRLVKLLVLGRRRGYRARLLARLGLRARAPDPPEPAREEADASPEARQGEVEDGWRQVIPVEELPPGRVIEVIPEGTPLAVAHVGDRFYALDNVCPHAGGPLGAGDLEGHELICPYHGWSYDVRDGSCLTDEELSVRTFAAEQRGEHVCVCLDADRC